MTEVGAKNYADLVKAGNRPLRRIPKNEGPAGLDKATVLGNAHI